MNTFLEDSNNQNDSQSNIFQNININKIEYEITEKVNETNFEYENNKIVKDLGYKFIPVEQTIAETAARYLQSKKDHTIFSILND